MTCEMKHGLKPPELARIHVMGHGSYGHGTAHHFHWGAAHKAGREHESVYSQAFELPCYFKALGPLHAATEAVVHIHLHYHAHVVAGMFRHAAYHPLHKAHTVLERAAVFVVAVIGIRRQELADQVAMSGMNLNAVESRFACQIHGVAEVFYQ